MQLALNVIRKDWTEYKGLIFILTCGAFVPGIASAFSEDFANGAMLGVLIGGTYGYAQFCFINERQRGTLNLLLSLPVSSFNLALAKFASLYSMVFVTANVPMLFFVRSLHTILVVNALAVFIATLSMAAAVVSESPWLPQLPMWLVIFISVPSKESLNLYLPGSVEWFHWSTVHSALLSVIALVVSPLLALVSCWIFSRRNRAW